MLILQFSKCEDQNLNRLVLSRDTMIYALEAEFGLWTSHFNTGVVENMQLLHIIDETKEH